MRGVRVSGDGQKSTRLRNACGATFAGTCPQQTPIAFHAGCGKPWGRIPFHGKGLRPRSVQSDRGQNFTTLRNACGATLPPTCPHQIPTTLHDGCGKPLTGMDKKQPRPETLATCGSQALVHIKPPSLSTPRVEKRTRHSLAGFFPHHQLYERPSWAPTSRKPMPPLCRLSSPQPRQPPDRSTCTPALAS